LTCSMSALQYARTELLPREQNPSRATRGSVGLDLFLPSGVVIQPGSTAEIDLKVTFRFPPLVYGQLQLRSSSALLGIELVGGVIGKRKTLIVQLVQIFAPPTPDNDYRGSVIAYIRNNGSAPVSLEGGKTYLQMVPVVYFDGHVERFDRSAPEEEVSERGSGKFGSTTKN
jgi:prepilin-type processing-associated H-X9-DG protein